jgi:flavin reductase (DIM6/NTAB) family NADH-FMN oxidoreductase RutF
MAINPQEYKKAFSKFATGVTIVSTIDENNIKYGITVNSFNTVSIAPPLILFSIINGSTNEKHFTDGDFFNINILNEQQQDLSNHFANPNLQTTWENVKHGYSANNCPIISDTLATIECKKYRIYDGGDHSIIIGEVYNTQINNDKNPLIYFNSTYYNL